MANTPGLSEEQTSMAAKLLYDLNRKKSRHAPGFRHEMASGRIIRSEFHDAECPDFGWWIVGDGWRCRTWVVYPNQYKLLAFKGEPDAFIRDIIELRMEGQD